MTKESDKHYEYLKTYIAQIAMLEFIKDNNLIDDTQYKKIKNKIENEYAKRNKLNNSNYGFAYYLKYAIIQQLGKE